MVLPYLISVARKTLKLLADICKWGKLAADQLRGPLSIPAILRTTSRNLKPVEPYESLIVLLVYFPVTASDHSTVALQIELRQGVTPLQQPLYDGLMRPWLFDHQVVLTHRVSVGDWLRNLKYAVRSISLPQGIEVSNSKRLAEDEDGS